MPVDLTVPQPLPLRSLVLSRSEPPEEASLRQEIRAWIERVVPEPRRRALGVRVGELSLEVCPVSEVLPPDAHPPARWWQPGAEEVAALAQARQAMVLGVPARFATLEEDLALAAAAARALALHCGGVVVEPVSHALECLDDQWAAPPAGLSDQTLVRVLSSELDGEVWATTLGLARLGLPELEVRRVPVRLILGLAPFLEEAARALLSQLQAGPRIGTLPLDGMEVGVTAWGDRLRLHPPGRRTGDLGPLLADRMGVSLAESEVHSAATRLDLREAVERARRELPEVRQRFVAGLEASARLCVHAVFTGPEGDESLWLSVQRFTRHQVRGRLVEAPRSVPLRLGQRVCVPVDQVIDWRIDHADGRREGGCRTAP